MAEKQDGPQNTAAEAPSQTGAQGATRDLLTVDQAATYLHVSTSSIRSYIRQGKLKAFRVAGIRQVRIPWAELLKLLEPARETTGP